MNNVKSIENLIEEEIRLGIYGGITKGSWHDTYKSSAWVFLGGFSFELTEGDIICVMSQWGEIEDIHLVREKETGKSKGFAFIKYEDQRSTILAVDNFNGVKLLGRVLRCDHVDQYKLPKEVKDKEIEAFNEDPEHRVQIGPGHAYRGKELANDYDIKRGMDLWNPSSSAPVNSEREHSNGKRKHDASDDDSSRSSESSSSSNRDKHEDHKRRHRRDQDEKRDSRDRKHDHKRKKDRKHRKDKKSKDRKDDHRSQRKAAKEQEKFQHDYVAKIASRFELAPGAAPVTSGIATYALPEGVVPSWRGNRDPEFQQKLLAIQMKKQAEELNQAQGGSSSNNNKLKPEEELSGIGGMRRTR
jgi:RNA-binding motif X-linked protein 2